MRSREAMKEIEDNTSKLETLENVKRMLFKQNKELNNKISYLDLQKDKITQKLNDTIKNYDLKLIGKDREKNNSLNHLRTELTTKYDTKINELIQSHKDEIDLMRQTHSNQLREITNDCGTQLQKLKTELEETKTKLTAREQTIGDRDNMIGELQKIGREHSELRLRWQESKKGLMERIQDLTDKTDKQTAEIDQLTQKNSVLQQS